MTPAALGLALALAAAPVRLELSPTCQGLDLAEARRVLAVELRSSDAEGRWATRVLAACDGAVVRLEVEDPVSRKSLQRTVDLGPVAAPARSRTLGLAAAELVATSWSELATNPRPAVEPAAPPPPPEAREEARASALARLPGQSRILAEATLAFSLGAPLVLWGGGLRWSWERFPALGLELELRLEHGALRFEGGEVFVNRAALGVGGHLRATLGAVALRGVLGLRGGAVELTGVPRAGSGAVGGSGVGPWLGLALGGAASARLGPVSVELAVEAGAPLAGVVGLVDGAPAVPLNGFWLGAWLGVGLAP